jgi:hypothetical protein
MRVLQRRSLILGLFLALLSAGAFWATATLDAAPGRAKLPTVGVKAGCPEDGVYHPEMHGVILDSLGYFQEQTVEGPSQIMIETGPQFKSRNGLRTVPFQIVSIAGRGFAEGIGQTQFRLDASRPVPSAIWEKKPGTDFPAIQEMRFHFFYTVEAMPDKFFRSVNPAVMRSENVGAFPPPPGTTYRLVKAVELEDVNEPGVVVGRIVSNQVVVPRPRAERGLN